MRTDPHSPTNLVTEDYEFVGCGDYGTVGEPGYSPVGPKGPGHYLLAEGWRFGGEGGGNCDHCGARIRYYAVLKHMPSHTLITIGETCLANRFDRATAEFQRMRKQAVLDRKAQRIKHARNGWYACDEDREVAFTWAAEQVEDGSFGYNGMRHTFVSQINRYGSVSDKFVRAIMRDMARTERFAAERAARDAAEAATASPVIEGRIEITGEVLSVRLKENDYGTRLVMTVRDDRGFKVWGTVPRALEDIPVMQPLDRETLEYQIKLNLERHANAVSGTFYKDLVDRDQKLLDEDDGQLTQTGQRSVERGERVTFTAQVERSDKDESFGFFKRPSKARLLEETA